MTAVKVLDGVDIALATSNQMCPGVAATVSVLQGIC